MTKSPKTIKITPRDPLVARDGRPFSEGKRMKSLDWIRPSVVIGSLRTLVGKLNQKGFNKNTIKELKDISITGPFPYVNNKLYFPTPLDMVLKEEGTQNSEGEKSTYTSIHQLKPGKYNEGEGSTLPRYLSPAMLYPKEQFKPLKRPAFCSKNQMTQWLLTKDIKTSELNKLLQYIKKDGSFFNNNNVINFPKKEERIHLKICPESGSAEEGKLFSSIGLDMNIHDNNGDILPLEMLAKLDTDIPQNELFKIISKLNHIHPCGGERRLVKWNICNNLEKIWECPKEIQEAIKREKKLRMVLATPAIFENGWLPGWLTIKEEHETKCIGTIPGTEIEVQLVSVVNERWQPLSGWSYERNKPKPISRMVPAGSVYFFKITNSVSDEDIANMWLQSVCDDTQLKKDGFGLSLWGIW